MGVFPPSKPVVQPSCVFLAAAVPVSGEEKRVRKRVLLRTCVFIRVPVLFRSRFTHLHGRTNGVRSRWRPPFPLRVSAGEVAIDFVRLLANW